MSENDKHTREKPELNILDPEHPLLDKFQKVLKEHLLLQIEYAKSEIFEYETGTKKILVEKEELGLKTYESQQLVCKQERQLENIISELQTVTAAREELEHTLHELKTKQKDERQQLIQAEKTDVEIQNEIGSMNLLIHQITQWEDKMESNIVVNQRIAEKTRKDNLRLANEKREQDMLIYKLMNEIWRLESEIGTLEMQCTIKDKEREELADTVASANTNVDALQAEYRCLAHSWNSVVVAISNRDKVIDCMNIENDKLQEKLKIIFCEIEQLKKLIKKEMNENEKLTMLKTRIEYDIKTCKTQLDKEIVVKIELEKNAHEMQAIIDQTERDIERIIAENQAINGELTVVFKQNESVASERVQYEDRLAKLIESQITNNKAAINLYKIYLSTKEKNTNLEIILVETENKYRIRTSEMELDQYENKQRENHLQLLEAELHELENENKQLDAEKIKSENLIRSKERLLENMNVLVEKKGIFDSSNVENPQDTKINSLEKHIEEVQEKIKSLQSYWLREQRNLITVSKERQEQIHSSNLLKKQIMILTQKNLRINNDIDELKKEELKILRNINALQNKSDVLCEILYKKRGYKTDLYKKNDVLQFTSDSNLKDNELECLRIQAELEEIEDEKMSLSKELIDLNREALEWEKRILLARETKGQIRDEQSKGGEVETMKQEIHRMNVRFSQLKKAQDKLINDLEHCVSRRDGIYMEAEARQKRNKKAEDRVRINFTRKMDDIKNKIKQTENEAKSLNQKSEATEEEKAQIRKTIGELKEDAVAKQGKIREVQEDLEISITNRQINFELLVLNQKKYNMYSDLVKGREPYRVYRNEKVLTEEYMKQKNLNSQLTVVVENLVMDFPNYNHELSRIYNSLKMFVLLSID